MQCCFWGAQYWWPSNILFIKTDYSQWHTSDWSWLADESTEGAYYLRPLYVTWLHEGWWNATLTFWSARTYRRREYGTGKKISWLDCFFIVERPNNILGEKSHHSWNDLKCPRIIKSLYLVFIAWIFWHYCVEKSTWSSKFQHFISLLRRIKSFKKVVISSKHLQSKCWNLR